MLATRTNVEEQLLHLRSITHCVNHSALIEESPIKGVVWCEDFYTANILRVTAERDGYRVSLRKGLRTNQWYAHCYF